MSSIKVQTSKSYDDNMLDSSNFASSLVWSKVGKLYLEAKAIGKYDEAIFTLAHKAVKQIYTFVKKME